MAAEPRDPTKAVARTEGTGGPAPDSGKKAAVPAEYEAIIEAFDGLIYICSQDFRVEFMNGRLIERTGYNGIGQPCYKVLHDRDSVCPWCVSDSILQGKTVRWEIRSPKDNHWYYVVNTPIPRADGTVSKMAMIHDITDRKTVEETLQRRDSILNAVSFAAEHFLKTPVWERSVHDVLARLGRALDVERVAIYENRSDTSGRVLTSLRYEWTGHGVPSLLYSPTRQGFSLRDLGFGRWEERLRTGGTISGNTSDLPESEKKTLTSQGVRSVLALPILLDNNWWGFIAFEQYAHGRDWSAHEIDALKAFGGILAAALARQRHEMELRNSEERNRVTLRAIPDIIFRIRRDGTFIDYKAEKIEDLAVPPDQIIGRKVEDILPKAVAQQCMRYIRQALATGERQVFEYDLALRGNRGFYEARVVVSGPDEVLTIVRNITEKKRAERELFHANRALRTLSECDQALTRASEEPGFLRAVCKILTEIGGYRMAWIGVAENDADKRVKPVAQAGDAEGYLEKVTISWGENEHGQGPTGRAIRARKPVISADMLNDPSYAPWRELALKSGFASSVALPMMAVGHVLGALNVYSEEPDAFDPQEVGLLSKLANEVGYGILSLRARVDREQTERALEHERNLFVEGPVVAFKWVARENWPVEYVSPNCE
jgi:PAS domain S-box-containing protein